MSEHSRKVCGKRMWSYDHWSCGRRRRHLGGHRFNNYVGARFPRFWRVKALVRTYKTNRRLASYNTGSAKEPRLFRYRQVLFPDFYRPVPVERRSPAVERRSS